MAFIRESATAAWRWTQNDSLHCPHAPPTPPLLPPALLCSSSQPLYPGPSKSRTYRQSTSTVTPWPLMSWCATSVLLARPWRDTAPRTLPRSATPAPRTTSQRAGTGETRANTAPRWDGRTALQKQAEKSPFCAWNASRGQVLVVKLICVSVCACVCCVKVCKERQLVKHQCNSTHDQLCECAPGFRLVVEFCITHSTCPPGSGVVAPGKNIILCNVCIYCVCYIGYFSFLFFCLSSKKKQIKIRTRIWTIINQVSQRIFSGNCRNEKNVMRVNSAGPPFQVDFHVFSPRVHKCLFAHQSSAIWTTVLQPAATTSTNHIWPSGWLPSAKAKKHTSVSDRDFQINMLLPPLPPGITPPPTLEFCEGHDWQERVAASPTFIEFRLFVEWNRSKPLVTRRNSV